MSNEISNITPQLSPADRERLAELIDQYELRLEDGLDVSAEMICAGNEDLIPAFVERVQKISRANRNMAMATEVASRPEIPGYEILEKLGNGGSAVVYRAIQTEMQREVALKVLQPNFGEGGFFEREIRAAQKLKHAGIPVVYDCGQVGRGNSAFRWVAMELLSGGAVDVAAVSSQPVSHILLLFEKVLQAIQFAHGKGVLHRDIKPSNILLDEAGEPHVADFGISKVLEESAPQFETVRSMGTPAYSAPELVMGLRDDPDVVTEIYSLGVVLFKFLTGRHPVDAANASLPKLQEAFHNGRQLVSLKSARQSVSVDLTTFANKLLAVERKDRYQSFLEVQEDLRRLIEHRPITARRIGLAERVRRWSIRQPGTAMAALSSLAIVCFLAVRLVLSDLQIREYANSLETRTTELTQSVDRLNRAVVGNRLMTIQQTLKSNRIRAAKMLNDEALFPADTRGFAWRILSRQAEETIHDLSDLGGGFGRIVQLSLDAKSEFLVVGSQPGDVSIVDIKSRKRISLGADLRQGANVVFAADNASFFCQGQDGDILRIQKNDGIVLRRYPIEKPIRTKMTITHDGRFLLELANDGTVLRLDLATDEVHELSGRCSGLPVAIWVSPDDRELHILNRESQWLSWDLETDQMGPERSVPIPAWDGKIGKKPKLRAATATYESSFGFCIALSFGNGLCSVHWPEISRRTERQMYPLIRSAPSTRHVQLWFDSCLIADGRGGKIFSVLSPGEERRLRPEDEKVRVVAIGRDRRLFATGGEKGTLHVTVPGSRFVVSTRLTTSARYPLIRFGPPIRLLDVGDGRVLICHREGWFSLLNISNNETLEAFQLGKSQFRGAVYSKKQNAAYLMFREPDLRLIGIQSGHDGRFCSTSTARDPEHLHSVTIAEKNNRDNKSDVKETELRDTVHSILFEKSFPSRIEAMCVSSNEEHVLVALRNGEVFCCNATTGETVSTWKTPNNMFRRVALAAANQQIVSGSHEGWIRWHDLRTGEIQCEWKAHSDGITQICVDEARGILFSASRDNTIRSWTFNGTKVSDFVGHYDRGISLAVSKDGSTLASGGSGNQILIWDTFSGERQLVLDSHSAPVVDMFFDGDQRLYSTSLDQAVRIWNGGE